MIFAAGDSIEAVYFPHDGLVSLVIGLSTGEMIEVGMIGRNSLVGVSSAFGNKIALSRAVAQTTGRGSVLHVDRFCDLAERSTAFRAILARVIGKLGVRPSVRVWESLYILFDERDRFQRVGHVHEIGGHRVSFECPAFPRRLQDCEDRVEAEKVNVSPLFRRHPGHGPW